MTPTHPSRPIRVLITDDHPIFRDGLRRLLESEPGFDVDHTLLSWMVK